ncbi:hypothetical protein KP509_33G017500 [Ceratopteris richardii]|nr:hypothetical protein KP509_33G017500 [Ceratopteris richardii]
MHRDDESACHLLQKALHIYPQCLAIRSKLMRLLLERSNGLEAHVAARCCSLEISRFQISISTNQANEAASATAVACSACGNIKPQASFSSCNSNYHFMKDTIKGLQRWIHSEPWNIMSQYHLVLALLQQAREQRFPVHMCRSIQRLIETVLARMSANDCEPSQIVDHAHLQMLLCKSEVSLQTGGLESALQSASKASELNIPQNLAAVPWLQLTRCHISSGNSFLANANLSKAVNLKAVDFPTFLCILDLTSTLEEDITLKLERMEILDIKGKNSHIVKALIEWKKAEICIRQRDLPLAEAAASKSVASWPEEKSLHLFHGAICMELLNHGWSSVNLTDTCRRLMKATRGDGKCLPIAGLLLAQVQENKAGTPGWERLLRMEWNLWPADMKPAELYFQMGVLARVSKTSGSIPSSKLWFQRAVHVNPSCGSYWKVLVPSEGNDMLK